MVRGRNWPGHVTKFLVLWDCVPLLALLYEILTTFGFGDESELVLLNGPRTLCEGEEEEVKRGKTISVLWWDCLTAILLRFAGINLYLSHCVHIYFIYLVCHLPEAEISTRVVKWIRLIRSRR